MSYILTANAGGLPCRKYCCSKDLWLDHNSVEEPDLPVTHRPHEPLELVLVDSGRRKPIHPVLGGVSVPPAAVETIRTVRVDAHDSRIVEDDIHATIRHDLGPGVVAHLATASTTLAPNHADRVCVNHVFTLSC